MSINCDTFRIAMLLKELYSKTMYSIEDSFKENGLTHQQIIVIKLIAHNKELTISDLCEQMSLAKGTVSGIVTRLEQNDFVEKFKKEDDKRNTYLRFTKKGMAFTFNFREKIQHSFDGIFENCTDEELNDLVSSLRNILSKIKE
ncbi:MarR family winged helix-turn-helix transcriptional regulator [Romboutsia sp.]|uniref:MarR family winged helix-turn-helix transcriptional regulator n=1 Tax=Romboutsia sp. TaxID=1965302 RepID=UPI003F3A73A2